jgi:uncharacterized protein (TIGR00251 family)
VPLSVTGRGRLRLALKLSPRSKKEGVEGVQDGRLHIKLTAPAVDGKANAALVAFLARLLEVKKTQVLLVTGEKARLKVVEIEGCDLSQARARLGLEPDPTE